MYNSTICLQFDLKFMGETLSRQMIHVFRKIDNKSNSVFNTISPGIYREQFFFLRVSMMNMKGKEGEEE